MYNEKEFDKAIMRIENITTKYGLLTEQAIHHIMLRARRMTKVDKIHAYLSALESENFHSVRSDVHTYFLSEGKL